MTKRNKRSGFGNTYSRLKTFPGVLDPSLYNREMNDLRRFVSSTLLWLGLLSNSGCRTPDGASTLRSDVDEPAAAALDQRFGAPHPPAYSKTWEHHPDGSTVVNPGLQTCADGVPLVPDPSKLQIWADLKDGTLVLSEEVVVGTAPNGKKLRLGRPTLTDSGEARIAGELRWDAGHAFINNKSGRYSSWPDRGPEQLAHAAELFHDCGVEVTTKYFNMMSTQGQDQ